MFKLLKRRHSLRPGKIRGNRHFDLERQNNQNCP